ncbi:hypothetical protein BASA81_002650 [Batrachochytrium salamandrivorans]|nr:hypothetical protein BASA81_002650 [Batrachochytrium salamandrivorans]
MDKTYYSGEEHVFYTNSSTSDNKVYIRPKRGQELIFEGTVAGGGGLPGEPDRSVQFNNGGVFDGDGEFTYNPEDEILTVTKVLVNDSLVAGTILGAESVSDGVFNTSAGVVTFAEITDVSNDVCCRSLFDSANNPIKIDASVPNIGDVLVFKGLSEAKWEPVSVDGITINNATINDSILNSPVLKHDVTSEELDQEIAQAKSFCLWSNLTDAPSQGTSCGMGLTNDLSTYRVLLYKLISVRTQLYHQLLV